jgi:hypothetical protein
MVAEISTKFLRRKICRGCYTYESYLKYIKDYNDEDFPICSIKPIVGGKVCPCVSCLVKMVCENTCNNLELHIKAGEYEKRV